MDKVHFLVVHLIPLGVCQLLHPDIGLIIWAILWGMDLDASVEVKVGEVHCQTLCLHQRILPSLHLQLRTNSLCTTLLIQIFLIERVSIKSHCVTDVLGTQLVMWCNVNYFSHYRYKYRIRYWSVSTNADVKFLFLPGSETGVTLAIFHSFGILPV